MMKLIKRAILFYLLIFGVSLVFQSCCEHNIKIVGNGKMKIRQIDNFRQDTINNEFILALNLDVTYANLGNVGIISSGYALQCEENYVNRIIKESISLRCNKDFTYNNEIVKSNTNFLNKELMSLHIDEEGGSIGLYIKQNFLKDTEFSVGTHEFSISLETTDGNTFQNSVVTYLNF